MKTSLLLVSFLLISAFGGYAQTSMPTPVIGTFMIVEERVTLVSPAAPAPYQYSAAVVAVTDTLTPAPLRPVQPPGVRRIRTVPVWPSPELVNSVEPDPYALFSGYQQFWTKPGPGNFRLMTRGQPR